MKSVETRPRTYEVWAGTITFSVVGQDDRIELMKSIHEHPYIDEDYALIHSIDCIYVIQEKDFDKVLNNHESYLVPSMYNGKIWTDEDARKNIDPIVKFSI